MNTIEAMKQALEDLDPLAAYGRVGTRDVDQAKLQQAFANFRTAIEQMEKQEPVGKFYANGNGFWYQDTKGSAPESVPLYLHPSTACTWPKGRCACDEVLQTAPVIATYPDGSFETGKVATPYTAPAVPTGFVLVPIEPTLAMWAAASDCDETDDAKTDCDNMWKAMLNAAPKGETL